MLLFLTPLLALAKSIFNFLKPILLFTIPLPVFIILIAGIWVYYDRGSYANRMVKEAVKELVAGAELHAQEELIKAQVDIINDQKDRIKRSDELLEVEKEANQEFDETTARNEKEKAELLGKINVLSKNREKSDEDCGCVVDQQLIDSLQSNKPNKTK